MKHILLIVFIGLLYQANGQISITEFVEGSTDDLTSLELKATVTNESNQEINLWWAIDDSAFPEDWKIQVCDNNLCYNFGILECPEGNPNIMAAGESFDMKILVLNESMPDSGSFKLRIFDDNSNESTGTLSYSINGVLSSNESIFNEDLSIFPNPTTDEFQLRNDQLVSKVAVYNIVGKSLFNYNHIPGNTYYVSHLQKGMYLVRLFDKNDIVLNVFRLNKN